MYSTTPLHVFPCDCIGLGGGRPKNNLPLLHMCFSLFLLVGVLTYRNNSVISVACL